MRQTKPLSFLGGWMFQDKAAELHAFEQHYQVKLPHALVERIGNFAEGLLSTTRKIGYADGKSVWWMTLLKLRLPKTCDLEAHETAISFEKQSSVPNPVFHDLIPVYLKEGGTKFTSAAGDLRFLPFGGAQRFVKCEEGNEQGFLCFDLDDNYSVWYLPAHSTEKFRMADSFEQMMLFPQRNKRQ